jgi:hypothetical protein
LVWGWRNRRRRHVVYIREGAGGEEVAEEVMVGYEREREIMQKIKIQDLIIL